MSHRQRQGRYFHDEGFLDEVTHGIAWGAQLQDAGLRLRHSMFISDLQYVDLSMICCLLISFQCQLSIHMFLGTRAGGNPTKSCKVCLFLLAALSPYSKLSGFMKLQSDWSFSKIFSRQLDLSSLAIEGFLWFSVVFYGFPRELHRVSLREPFRWPLAEEKMSSSRRLNLSTSSPKTPYKAMQEWDRMGRV